MSDNIFLDVKNLTKGFSLHSGISKSPSRQTSAVEDVSFKIFNSESFGLVGETGCGKSTLGRCLIRLTEPDQGQIVHNNVNIMNLSVKDFRPYRSKFQMIFQNPGQSLNPIHSIRRSISEPIHALKLVPPALIPERLEQLLKAVGLENHILDYLPDQLSGGQKQRVVIARVLAVNPSFIIADEPTSSVDATIKRQILDLLKNIRIQFGLTLLLISHDLSIVDYATDRTAVMYKGCLVEVSPTKILLQKPGHPYSRELIQSSRLKLNIDEYAKGIDLARTVPFFKGCSFVDSCPHVKTLCKNKKPELQKSAENRFVACHFPDKLLA